MRIEIACDQSEANKAKGDLFENLAKDLLEAQQYEVIQEIRFTGVELDLLCKHRVNGKQIYVECKAQKEKINAEILRKLLGTVDLYDYSEGWLVSTAEFGKEAKGFVEIWKTKPPEKSEKLSFYTPDLVIESLQRASVIVKPPMNEAEAFLGNPDCLGSWTLLVTKYGRYWTVFTLKGGSPHGVLIYSAKTGKHIQDEETLSKIAQLETPLAEYDIFYGQTKISPKLDISIDTTPKVVEVQIGDSWNDYRPARPKDFVGRDDLQKEILTLLNNIKDKSTDTRIFAITGNSGLGKSSLIAKIRDRSKNKWYKNKYFVYAVDIRGAKTPSYITASLLKCLNEAQKSGFGEPISLQLTDPSSPLSSESISQYLSSIEEKEQVICLIFDQFEELYSKPELFNVFTASKDLMFEVASFKGNFSLGFAWKTDSTTHQDHPAYHMWHELSDYRKVYKLDVFDNGEICKSITTFEKEVDQKLPPDLRRQIVYSCQGFPWLLKKLCINLYENLKKGEGDESILIDLDVNRLFQTDLELLTQPELACLKLIAQKAPADWSEIIELSTPEVLKHLVNKRLVIKSGDRLNIYWDIFKDYLLTGKVPIIPFNYIPTSDYGPMWNVANLLETDKFINSRDLANMASLKERTVLNIAADLVMFGIAERNNSNFKLHKQFGQFYESSFLQQLRDKFGKHSLNILLFDKYAGKSVNQTIISDLLRESLKKASSSYSEQTWTMYATRLTKFLLLTGYLVQADNKFIVQDTGTPTTDQKTLSRKGKGKGKSVFSASASPYRVCELLELIDNNNKDSQLLTSKKYRNALSVLKRFELVIVNRDSFTLNTQSIKGYGDQIEAVWTLAKNEPAIDKCVHKLHQNIEVSGIELGEYISSEYGLNWKKGSKQRNGNALRQWAIWVKEGLEKSKIPTPPGRRK